MRGSAWIAIFALVSAPALAAGGTVFPEPRELAPYDDFAGELAVAPTLQWQVDLPGGPARAGSHSERTRPLVLGDVILVGSTWGDGLYMLSRRNGSLIRKFPAKDAVESEAVVVDDRVYFSDTGGTSWCYQLDGTLVWTHEGTAPVLARPTVADGRVIVADVADLAVALSATSGDLVWRYQAKRDVTRGAELALYAAPTPLIADGQVILGFSDGSLVGLDARTGNERWAKRLGEGRYPDVVAESVTRDGVVYASGFYTPFVAFDLASRNTLWRVDIGAAFGAAVSADDSGVSIYHAGSDGKVRSLSALTGAERWVWDSGDGAASITTPQVTPAGLVVASTVGSAYILDPADGKLLWEIPEPFLFTGVSSVPVVAGRQLLVVSNAGRLYSFIAPRPEPEPKWLDRERGN